MKGYSLHFLPCSLDYEKAGSMLSLTASPQLEAEGAWVQGMAVQQGKLQLGHEAAASKTIQARESLTSTLQAKEPVFTGDTSPSIGTLSHIAARALMGLIFLLRCQNCLHSGDVPASDKVLFCKHTLLLTAPWVLLQVLSSRMQSRGMQCLLASVCSSSSGPQAPLQRRQQTSLLTVLTLQAMPLAYRSRHSWSSSGPWAHSSGLPARGPAAKHAMASACLCSRPCLLCTELSIASMLMVTLDTWAGQMGMQGIGLHTPPAQPLRITDNLQAAGPSQGAGGPQQVADL